MWHAGSEDEGQDSDGEEDSDQNTDRASSSRSDSEDEEQSPEQTDEQRRAALKAAIRDARHMLKDRPRKKAMNSFVEDEVGVPASGGESAACCWLRHMLVHSPPVEPCQRRAT